MNYFGLTSFIILLSSILDSWIGTYLYKKVFDLKNYSIYITMGFWLLLGGIISIKIAFSTIFILGFQLPFYIFILFTLGALIITLSGIYAIIGVKKEEK